MTGRDIRRTTIRTTVLKLTASTTFHLLLLTLLKVMMESELFCLGRSMFNAILFFLTVPTL